MAGSLTGVRSSAGRGGDDGDGVGRVDGVRPGLRAVLSRGLFALAPATSEKVTLLTVRDHPHSSGRRRHPCAGSPSEFVRKKLSAPAKHWGSTSKSRNFGHGAAGEGGRSPPTSCVVGSGCWNQRQRVRRWPIQTWHRAEPGHRGRAPNCTGPAAPRPLRTAACRPGGLPAAGTSSLLRPAAADPLGAAAGRSAGRRAGCCGRCRTRSRDRNLTPYTGEPVFAPPSFNPVNGALVGVAKPIMINFARLIANRGLAESAIHIVGAAGSRPCSLDSPTPRSAGGPTSFRPQGTIVIDASGAKSSFRVGDSLVAISLMRRPLDDLHRPKRQGGEDHARLDGQARRQARDQEWYVLRA